MFNPDVVFKSFQDAIQLKPPLDRLEVLVVSCVFNKTIEKLMIIKELLQGTEKIEHSGYQSPTIRMKEREKFVPPVAQLPDSVQSSQHIKWQTIFILDLFEETLTELNVQGSQVYLEYTLCCENFKLFDNQMVKNENKDHKKLIYYLEEKLKNYKQNNNKTQQYLLESTGPCLDKAVVNTYAEENLGTIYSCTREVTRTEKNVLKLKENERAVQKLKEKLISEVEEENLIHQEVNSHLVLLLTELTNKVEYWTNKYNTEINQLDIDLLQMKSQKDEQTTALETLKSEFFEKKEIVEALQAESDSRDTERGQKSLENRAAEKIQKWWKNILFKKRFLKQFVKKLSKNKNQTTKKKTKKIV